MRRKSYEDLLSWKADTNRMPLIITGVRQCGKTYLVREFGNREFKNLVELNFEKKPNLKELFEMDFDVKRIIREIGIEFNVSISPSETLIFFDEIQGCPAAITSLKYFCEDAPEYHIVAAGSLLGVMLSEVSSFPVGKVDRLQLYPMSFQEFLWANGEDSAAEFISNYVMGDRIPKTVSDKLESYLKQYYVVGGMPKIVESWVNDGNVVAVTKMQKKLLKDYSSDFYKHVTGRNPSVEDIMFVWNSIPCQLSKPNNKFMFGHAKKGVRSKDLEAAVQWLVDAGLVYRVCRSDNPAMPLKSNHNVSVFKLYFVDVGLLRVFSEAPPNFMNDDGNGNFKGSFTENYVLCELIAQYGDEQYYWSDGRHEVDFLVHNGSIIPLEVKSERKTSSVSLSAYCEKYKPKTFFLASLGETRPHVIPLYAVLSLKNQIE